MCGSIFRGRCRGPKFAAFGRGRFTIAGAISDRGRFVDKFEGIHPPNGPHVRTLRGAKGTIQMMVARTKQWRITNGTNAYAGLRGQGTQQGHYAGNGIDATMIGTVSR